MIFSVQLSSLSKAERRAADIAALKKWAMDRARDEHRVHNGFGDPERYMSWWEDR